MLCAILVCLEYIWIGRYYRPNARILLVSFFIKALFIIGEIGVAIGFGVCMGAKTKNRKNVAAVLEWGRFQQIAHRDITPTNKHSCLTHFRILRLFLCRGPIAVCPD